MNAKIKRTPEHFPVEADGKPLLTPGKQPLQVPTQAMAMAIAEEWRGKKMFNAATMPLTALAYTAIDRAEAERGNIVEILLAYVDTDTLCYRASGAKDLQQRQHEQWDPILAWAGAKFSALWQTTDGVYPLNQPEALHESLNDYLQAMEAMKLAACGVLSSLYSSLVLAIAVMEKKITAQQAFTLSRLEEDYQAEKWGEDDDAKQRRQRIAKEIEDVARFLILLEKA